MAAKPSLSRTADGDVLYCGLAESSAIQARHIFDDIAGLF
jgi:hypothetical protein